MRYDLSGTVMQTVGIDLAPGETVYSQTNCMCWMTDGIEMNTHTGGGFLAGLKRSFSGGSLFITDFTARSPAHVAFAPRFPGTIVPVQLGAGQALICRKETFLCAEKSVVLEIAWQKKMGAGFFGGQGFILQKVTGPAWSGSTCPGNWWNAILPLANGSSSTPAMSASWTRASASTSRWCRASRTSCSAAKGYFSQRSPGPDMSCCKACRS